MVINHDEDMAAQKAREFAEVAFIKRDYQAAFGLLSAEAGKHFSPSDIERVIKEMHGRSFPDTVMATDFEPMPGQKAMAIYLTGRNENEEFYYRFVMQGTTQTGYTVSGFFRGATAYPASKLRQSLK